MCSIREDNASMSWADFEDWGPFVIPSSSDKLRQKNGVVVAKAKTDHRKASRKEQRNKSTVSRLDDLLMRRKGYAKLGSSSTAVDQDARSIVSGRVTVTEPQRQKVAKMVASNRSDRRRGRSKEPARNLKAKAGERGGRSSSNTSSVRRSTTSKRSSSGTSTASRSRRVSSRPTLPNRSKSFHSTGSSTAKKPAKHHARTHSKRREGSNGRFASLSSLNTPNRDCFFNQSCSSFADSLSHLDVEIDEFGFVAPHTDKSEPDASKVPSETEAWIASLPMEEGRTTCIQPEDTLRTQDRTLPRRTKSATSAEPKRRSMLRAGARTRGRSQRELREDCSSQGAPRGDSSKRSRTNKGMVNAGPGSSINAKQPSLKPMKSRRSVLAEMLNEKAEAHQRHKSSSSRSVVSSGSKRCVVSTSSESKSSSHMPTNGHNSSSSKLNKRSVTKDVRPKPPVRHSSGSGRSLLLARKSKSFCEGEALLPVCSSHGRRDHVETTDSDSHDEGEALDLEELWESATTLTSPLPVLLLGLAT